ncbi:MAG: hypothetical protein HYX96_03360 [Chloroflexi bacterium]|nr:hypothetical protein [Chloroflexota bacterium]
MNDIQQADRIAEKLRRKPYRLLTNDCLTKSLRLKRACRDRGIEAKVVACLGLGRARLFGRWLTIPVIHGWGEVGGQRIETSRPLGAAGLWGIVPVKVRPVICLKF